MNGTIHTCVTLAKAARGCLRCGRTAESLGDGRAVASYAHAVVFCAAAEGDSQSRRVVAHDPVEWLRHLMATDARDAWVLHAPSGGPPMQDHIAAAFANGGGPWGVHVQRDGSAEVWIPHLRYAANEDPDRPSWWFRTVFPRRAARACRPWHVTVTRFPIAGSSATIPRADLGGLTSRVRTALVRNRDFATTWRLKPWDVQFDRAVAALDHEPVLRPDDGTVGPLGILDAAADRLLRACALAWCFGGMGTWNDVHVNDEASQQKQLNLAADLYAAVTDAVQQATWPAAAV